MRQQQTATSNEAAVIVKTIADRVIQLNYAQLASACLERFGALLEFRLPCIRTNLTAPQHMSLEIGAPARSRMPTFSLLVFASLFESEIAICRTVGLCVCCRCPNRKPYRSSNRQRCAGTEGAVHIYLIPLPGDPDCVFFNRCIGPAMHY